MNIGWIDFSKEDRNKALDVIKLLQEEGAVDELGMGTIRDAFANYFFPGTSTVQTRAKYFLIVPYALKEVAKSWNGTNVSEALQKLDAMEKQCGLQLYRSADTDGVIGKMVLPSGWVQRSPSNIYWGGIRTYNILKSQNISISEFFATYAALNQEKKQNKALLNRNDDNEDRDDKDAGDIAGLQLLNIPCYRSNWMENLKTCLTRDEAIFLREQIIKSVPDSLMGCVLKNNMELNQYMGFEDFSTLAKDLVNAECVRMMDLANRFNRLAHVAMTRYNYILSDGQNEEASAEWDRLKETLPEEVNVDADKIFYFFNINTPTRTFLKSVQQSAKDKDINLMDQILKNREIRLKGPARAKLTHIGETDPGKWVGPKYYDYRFSDARRIINDIYAGVSESV